MLNCLMPGVHRRLYILKQTCRLAAGLLKCGWQNSIKTQFFSHSKNTKEMYTK